MRTIGSVVRLQVQRSTLKTGEKPNRTYDPTPLLAVPQLAVSAEGVLGAADGGWVVDVHHHRHPHTKNEDLVHGVSLGFTSHYAAMRDRFGERIVLGCAGENIIVAAERQFSYAELAGGVAVGDVKLRVLQVAHPCRPFTGWALGGRVESDALKSHLQFLDDGMRGFYCHADEGGTVNVGDPLVLL